MATVQLLGRGTYGPHVAWGMDVSPLWLYKKMPPAQNSVLIYKNGDVVERPTPEIKDIKDDSVHEFILGGTRYRTQVGSFSYEALTAAGYTWQIITEPDAYSEDYEDSY
jgi:hypothetical protein